MASFSFANATNLFPAGTVVKAYPTKGFNPITLPSSGPPPGTSAAEATVESSGAVELTGLTEGQFYVLYAEVGGQGRYEKVYVQPTGEITVVASQATGDFAVMTAGKGFRVKEGSNAKMGSATLTAGKVTVANTSVTANSRIFVQRKGAAAKAGALTVTAKVAATSFTVESSNAEDASDFDYLIFEPA